MSDQEKLIKNFSQTWPMPSKRNPIIIIGTGGIVKDAHLPAYKKAGFEVAGLYDVDKEKAEVLAKDFEINKIYNSLEEAFENKDCIFDLALPPANLLEVVEKLPENIYAVLQKPLGRSLEEGNTIRKICHQKNIKACMNFQLRFSPIALPVYEAIQQNLLGELVELEVHVNVHTPWELWPFLKTLDRVEVPLHSIHYIDWIRSVLGNPQSLYCQSVKHPKVKELADCRTSAIFNYGDQVRCCMTINHTHSFGRKNQDAYIRLEGTKGAAKMTLGLLLDYPNGEPEELEIITEGTEWIKLDIKGKWFPDAFIGTMSSLQRFASGEEKELLHSVDNAYETMALVYACLKSNETLGTLVDYN